MEETLCLSWLVEFLIFYANNIYNIYCGFTAMQPLVYLFLLATLLLTILSADNFLNYICATA